MYLTNFLLVFLIVRMYVSVACYAFSPLVFQEVEPDDLLVARLLYVKLISPITAVARTKPTVLMYSLCIVFSMNPKMCSTRHRVLVAFLVVSLRSVSSLSNNVVLPVVLYFLMAALFFALLHNDKNITLLFDIQYFMYF